MGNNYIFSAVFSFPTLLFSQTSSLLTPLLLYIKIYISLCFGMCCQRKINFLSLCAEMIKPGNRHIISLVIDRLLWHLDDVFVRDC